MPDRQSIDTTGKGIFALFVGHVLFFNLVGLLDPRLFCILGSPDALGKCGWVLSFIFPLAQLVYAGPAIVLARRFALYGLAKGIAIGAGISVGLWACMLGCPLRPS